MNNNQTEGKCCQYFKQAIIIFAFLSLFFSIYSLDESVITIGSLNKNITNLSNQDVAPLSCLEICTFDYGQPYGQTYCCVNSTILTTCKTKQECKLSILNHYQNQLNTQYLYLLCQAAVVLLIIILFAVYCVKKRLQNARRRREASEQQIDDQNIHAPLFNFVGSLHMRREFEPANLQSSYLFEQSEHVCSICLQSLVQAKAIKLSCHHIFHSDCIKSWMQQKNTCPICRTKN